MTPPRANVGMDASAGADATDDRDQVTWRMAE
jgi:hypothetical protein